MNCQDTKNIDIFEYLTKSGITGTEKKYFVWYCSPFRNEKTPSFRLDRIANRWIDFGTGQNGDILDLVKLIHDTDTLGALTILSCNTDKSFSFSRPKIEYKEETPGIVIKHVQPIENKALIQYLAARGIPLQTARHNTVEAYYEANNKHFFSIAFKNDHGGYELRNKYFKNCSSPKYFTTFQVNENKELNLFEGFFDFLSALAFYHVQSLIQNTIVLNSLSNLNAVMPLLSNYEKINLYLDNDNAGRDAVEKIKSLHPFTEDKSITIYPFHKDFNEFFIKSFNNGLQ